MEASKWIRVLSSPDSVSKRRLDPLRVGDDKMQDTTNSSLYLTFGNGLVHKWLIFLNKFMFFSSYSQCSQ